MTETDKAASDSNSKTKKLRILIIGLIGILVIIFISIWSFKNTNTSTDSNSIKTEHNPTNKEVVVNVVNTSDSIVIESRESKVEAIAHSSESDESEDSTIQSSQTYPITQDDQTELKPKVELLDQKAMQVIRGDYGNGEVRKRKLGSEYEIIQAKVNAMYDKGLVY